MTGWLSSSVVECSHSQWKTLGSSHNFSPATEAANKYYMYQVIAGSQRDRVLSNGWMWKSSIGYWIKKQIGHICIHSYSYIHVLTFWVLCLSHQIPPSVHQDSSLQHTPIDGRYKVISPLSVTQYGYKDKLDQTRQQGT